jgi:CIC family chloride channel protein
VIVPSFGVDIRVAALVGMAAMFAGASRALLASAIFAFECTRQPLGMLPLIGGCTSAFLVSCLMMENSIMTERIARRGARVVGEYAADYLSQVLVKNCMSPEVVTVEANDTIADVRRRLEDRALLRHNGFPVVDGKKLVGVITRADVLDDALDEKLKLKDSLSRRPVVIYEDNSAREAADHMVAEGVGRLPVVSRTDPDHILGIITRGDLLSAHRRRLSDARAAEQSKLIPKAIRARFSSKASITATD